MDHEDGALLLIIALFPLIWPRRSFFKNDADLKFCRQIAIFLRISKNKH